MSKQIHKAKTKLVRLDAYVVQELKIEAARQNRTIRSLVEECLSELLGVSPISN